MAEWELEHSHQFYLPNTSQPLWRLLYYKDEGPQAPTYVAFSNFPWDAKHEGKLMAYSRSGYVAWEYG